MFLTRASSLENLEFGLVKGDASMFPRGFPNFGLQLFLPNAHQGFHFEFHPPKNMLHSCTHNDNMRFATNNHRDPTKKVTTDHHRNPIKIWHLVLTKGILKKEGWWRNHSVVVLSFLMATSVNILNLWLEGSHFVNERPSWFSSVNKVFCCVVRLRVKYWNMQYSKTDVIFSCWLALKTPHIGTTTLCWCWWEKHFTYCLFSGHQSITS